MSNVLLHIAGTEPTPLKELGRVSNLPETHGADILFIKAGVKYGIQRKELSDLLASVDDGRLGKELAQMSAAGVRGVLVIEGAPNWSTEGVMVRRHGRDWRRGEFWGRLLTVQESGVAVMSTKSLSETVEFVKYYVKWAGDAHRLPGRKGPTGLWGSSPTNRDFSIHVLTSVPGIGPDVAGKIYDAYGRLPLTWQGDWDTLKQVRGLGVKRLSALKALFEEQD